MIGVFDSGIGGLSVLKEIDRQINNCGYIYLADSAFTPYGDKSHQDIIERSIKLTGYLIDSGAKIIVVACNSATAIAVDILRQKFTLPIIAMEPAVKTAVGHTKKGKVGILATKMTLSSDRYARLLENFAEGAEVYEQACSGLVEQIEKKQLDTPETMQLISDYIKPLLKKQVDTLVLGCTHYPFLAQSITKITGENVSLIDTAVPVTQELIRQIKKLSLDKNCLQNKKFITTGEIELFQNQLNYFWHKQVTAEQIKID